MQFLPIVLGWYSILAGTIVLLYLYHCQLLRKLGAADNTSQKTIPLARPPRQPALPGDAPHKRRLRPFPWGFASSWNRGLVPGQLIHRYQIQNRLGQGTFAQVYLAECLVTGEFVALKWFGRWEAAWQHERHMLSRVSHPAFPGLLGAFRDAPLGYFLAMEYIPGVDLAHLLETRGGRLSVEEALDLGIQIAEALAYLHGLPTPMLHRDIKPENIRLMKIKRRRLMGVRARLFDLGIGSAGEKCPFVGWGTPEYAAPEVLAHRPCPASDIYSLGIVLWEVMSGQLPLPLARIFPCLPANLPPGLPALLRQMIAPEAAARPSASMVQAALNWLRCLCEGGVAA